MLGAHKPLDAIRANLDKGVEKGEVAAADRAAALERIDVGTDLSAAVANAEVVVEAAPEILDLNVLGRGGRNQHERRQHIVVLRTTRESNRRTADEKSNMGT